MDLISIRITSALWCMPIYSTYLASRNFLIIVYKISFDFNKEEFS